MLYKWVASAAIAVTDTSTEQVEWLLPLMLGARLRWPLYFRVLGTVTESEEINGLDERGYCHKNNLVSCEMERSDLNISSNVFSLSLSLAHNKNSVTSI